MSLAAIPLNRTIDGAVGTSLVEIRKFLSSVKDIRLLSGLSVSVTFTAADIAGSVVKRVLTGLGFPPTGFFITAGHVGAPLIQLVAPLTELDKTVLFLRATIATTYTIWVF